MRVDVTGAAASLLGFAFQRADDPAAIPAFDPARNVTGIYPTRDGGHFLLHGSFPDSQARALALLGCDEDVKAVAERIAGWDAQALEDAIAERGLCGARVRSAAEWAAHPQGRALATRAGRRGDQARRQPARAVRAPARARSTACACST